VALKGLMLNMPPPGAVFDKYGFTVA